MKAKNNWPNTVIFWGAGATFSLGYPTTSKQGILLLSLSNNKDIDDYLRSLRESNIFTGKPLEEMADLLFILDEGFKADETSPFCSRKINYFYAEQLRRAKSLFDIADEEELKNLVIDLRINYDFSALKQIVSLCPQDSSSLIMNVFTLIDYHFSNNEGFYYKGQEHLFIDKNRLSAARNALIMIIVSSMTAAYLSSSERKNELIKPYKKFTDDLANLMFKEAEERINNNQNEREFYLFSYAIISLNWDHFINWMIFNSHREFNDNPENDTFNGRHKRLKLFNDFAVLMGLRQLAQTPQSDKLTTKLWYPYNESVLQRINDPEYDFGKIVRVGKFYYPHGCLAWRCCPNCGSMTGSFGDVWETDSDSLFPPSLIPSLRKVRNRASNEKEWVNRGRFDALACSYCGTKTEIKDTPLLMQTAVKANVPPVLRVIQNDINACIENANHLVFMGYSLPQDDLVWRSILQARKDNVKCSVVLGYGGPDHWQRGKRKEDIISGDNERFWPEFKTFFDLFGPDNVRFCTTGIPNVFACMKVEELLNYD